MEIVDFSITIDGIAVKVTDSSQTILKIAKSVGISIPAPCFIDQRKKGACKVCVVEINKKQSYACRRKPTKDMKIIVDRKDLNIL